MTASPAAIRHDWTTDEALAVLERPFHDLVFDAQTVHRAHFRPDVVEGAILLSIKTGGCPEDCSYCPQSARYDTGLDAQRLLSTEEIVAAARNAKEAGASRFCMGAAWRSPNDRQVGQVAEAVTAVGELGLETCVTLGMLDDAQARALADAGLDYYNHNLDTSPDFYGEIITTRTYQDRLDTIGSVRAAGVALCCGGIVGMGESRRQRAGLLAQLAQLDPHPESVPINLLVQVPGTPMYGQDELDGLELVRTIAAARIMMPGSVVRLSAGREQMSDELQALCMHAGAASIFLGDKLLTTPNPGGDNDADLLDRLDTTLAEGSILFALMAATDWNPHLRDQFEAPYWAELQAFVHAERQRHTVYPPHDEVFAALHLTAYADTKVCILGQDPYHGPGQAHGLCFSVRPDVAVPPSLVNIFTELESDVGCPRPTHGNLESWATQGVLLLNTTLTVRAHQAASHQRKGWETFTDRVIETVAAKSDRVVFILWGASARKKTALIDTDHHTVIESPHPSPLSAHRGFFGSRPFSRANAALVDAGRAPIDWCLS